MAQVNITKIDSDFTRMITSNNFTLINEGQINKSTVNKSLPRLIDEGKEESEGDIGCEERQIWEGIRVGRIEFDTVQIGEGQEYCQGSFVGLWQGAKVKVKGLAREIGSINEETVKR